MTTQSQMMAPNQCRLEHGPLLNSCGLALSQGTEPSLHILVGKHNEMSSDVSLLHIVKVEDGFLPLQNSCHASLFQMDTFAF